MNLKLIETVASKRASGKVFNSFKSCGSMTGTNIFLVLPVGCTLETTRVEWFHVQQDTYRWLSGVYEKNQNTGKLYIPVHKAEKKPANE